MAVRPSRCSIGASRSMTCRHSRAREALLRPRQGVPDLFVVGPARPPGLEVFPEVRVVLEEARGAGAQHAGQAHELGLQLLAARASRRTGRARGAGKASPALQLVQLLDAARRRPGPRQLELELEAKRRDLQRHLARMALGRGRRAVDDAAEHAAVEAGAADLALVAAKAVLSDEKAERRLLGGGERLGEARRLGGDRRRREARLGLVQRPWSVLVVVLARWSRCIECHVGGKYHQVAATSRPKKV